MKAGWNRIRSRRQTTAGVSLIECLVYIAIVLVVMGCGFMALYRGMDNHKNLRRNADDITAAVNAGELWRKDIRAAAGRITTEAHEQNQTLFIPQSHGTVAYQFTDGELRRQGRASGPWVVVLPRVQSSSMTADPRERVTAWRWELALKSTAREARVKPVFTFEAVPGSNEP
jgi:hypothetical protein